MAGIGEFNLADNRRRRGLGLEIRERECGRFNFGLGGGDRNDDKNVVAIAIQRKPAPS